MQALNNPWFWNPTGDVDTRMAEQPVIAPSMRHAPAGLSWSRSQNSDFSMSYARQESTDQPCRSRSGQGYPVGGIEYSATWFRETTPQWQRYCHHTPCSSKAIRVRIPPILDDEATGVFLMCSAVHSCNTEMIMESSVRGCA